MGNTDSYRFSTKAIHAGEENDFKSGSSGDVVTPIHLSTTFAREKINQPQNGYEYTRSSNPTRKSLEQKLAALENARFGLAFSSGLSAESTILLSLLKSGDHVIAFDDLYGGTKRLFNHVFSSFNIDISYVDATLTFMVEDAIRPNTKLIWIETPTNPLLKICDIKAVSEIVKKHKLVLVVDNTFLSPYFQRPLECGADIVVHSSTKYIGGHSDVLGGSVMLSDEELYEKIRYRQNAIGAVLSPFDSYLTMRGIKTLELRMQQHNLNSIIIADFLSKHSKVKRVIYPGLESHPQHQLARQQSTGFGGIISFEVHGSGVEAQKFVENLNLFALAESLGGVESLIEIPALMTHSSVPVDIRLSIGITDTLIRMSVGIENHLDLISDISQAFDLI
jgi:cystathionine gamma-lyase